MSARDEAVEIIRRICPPHLDREAYGALFAEKFAAHRVEVLREAADVLDTLPADATSFDAAEHKYKGGAAAERLRRLADEAQQAPVCGDSKHRHAGACDLYASLNRERADEAQEAEPAGPFGEQELFQLRWGLDDVEYGDDDSVTVMLSGPHGEPYWLELDPERRDALRDALTAPEDEDREQEPATPPCTECGHSQTVHEPGQDPVTPGRCFVCDEDDAHHDYAPAGEAPAVVAYGLKATRALYCTDCQHSADVLPLTAEDLPDGGVCACCHTDVLAGEAQQAREGR